MKKTKLTYGIKHEGKLHVDFELRVPSIGDNIDALVDSGAVNNLATNTALLARCLVSLGEIPKDVITYEWLRNALVDEDYDVMLAELAEVKKKRREQKGDSSSSASLS